MALKEIEMKIGGATYPLSAAFKLKHSHVLVADFTDYTFPELGADIKIALKFNDDHRRYICCFECGDKKASFSGTGGLQFSGFTWDPVDGKVKSFCLNDVPVGRGKEIARGEDFVLAISIHEAVFKLPIQLDGGRRTPFKRSGGDSDVVDGLYGYESDEKASEVYGVDRLHTKGDMVMSLYVLFYTRQSAPISRTILSSTQ